MIKKMKNVCKNHKTRISIVTKNNEPLCWECYIGRDSMIQRFGPNFYKDEDEYHAKSEEDKQNEQIE